MSDRIIIETIPHKAQRYETVGDYYRRFDGDLQFKISKLSKEDYIFLVRMHEQIEQYLTEKRGILEADITMFDMEYEVQRPEGDTSEPGDSPKAPYHKEHLFATFIERQLALELNVDWKDYEEDINRIGDSHTGP